MKSIFSYLYMEIRKIYSGQRVPPGSINHSEKVKGRLHFVLVLSNILQNILSKRIVC